MPARYRVVDVFAREPLAGNALAVFPDPGSVEPGRMQRIAREMNLSETTFVTGVTADGYDVRIFTPTDELPFAGHPTLGTAWVLRELGAVAGEQVTQRSAAGSTPVEFDDDRAWFERTGSAGEDLGDVSDTLAELTVAAGDVGFDSAEIGGASHELRPAIADSGLGLQLMLPLASREVVAALRTPSSVTIKGGVYCFAALGRGRIKARYFAPGSGVAEDPATGSAAAALGLYLGARVGALSVEVEQGAEIARPSFISIEASPGRVRVGGSVHLAAEGSLIG
jgi:trans-2,3-dihydro-3-hydroxyanthranilate isomerase